MKNQKKDILLYLAFIQLCRKWEWLLRTGICNLFQKSHKILPRRKYFTEVMKLVGKKAEADYEFYKNEVLLNTFLKRNYLNAINTGQLNKKYKNYDDRFNNEANVVHYYALLREIQPKIVVETGTASGSMTSWMLAALHKNGHGKLISIDLPAVQGKLTMDITVEKGKAGFLIPHEFHDQWELLLGDAKILLPKILSEYDVDIFVHDSLHTRTHMLYEYQAARTLMSPGSIIMSDDILWNGVFFDFVASNHLTSLGCISNPNLGITINSFDEYESTIGVGIIKNFSQ